MSIAFKRFITVIFVAIIALHFILIGLFSSPLSDKSSRLKNLGFVYSYPFFYQSWKLFVPPPQNKYELYVRVKDETSQTWNNWFDMFANIRCGFNKQSIGEKELLTLLFSTEMNYAVTELGESKIFESLPESHDLKILNHSIKHNLKRQSLYNNSCQYEILLVTKRQEKTYTYYIKNLHLQ